MITVEKIGSNGQDDLTRHFVAVSKEYPYNFEEVSMLQSPSAKKTMEDLKYNSIPVVVIWDGSKILAHSNRIANQKDLHRLINRAGLTSN